MQSDPVERPVRHEPPSPSSDLPFEATTPVKRVRTPSGEPLVEHCKLDHQCRILPQPGRTRITKESLIQTVSDALDMAYDLLEEEEDYERDLLMTSIVQGEPASSFWSIPGDDDDTPPAAKRKR